MTIGLVMIVKDERDTLPRLAESLEGQIDYWTVVDTGSTDDTMAVVPQVFKGPGKLHQREWTDFSRARNEALDLARCHGGTDWLLVMDADEVLNGSLDLTCPSDAQVISARQIMGDVVSWLPRLIRADAPVAYRGRTHEYLEGVERQFATETFSVTHRGALTPAKFDRDLALLEQDLADDPYDIRAVSHMAQMWENAGSPENAITWYERRAKLRGDEIETWYATWRLGALLIATGKAEEGLGLFTRAIAMRPWRAEPYWLAAEHLRSQRCWRMAFDVCTKARQECALDATPPGGAMRGDRAFILRIAYEWAIDYEQAIAAYHVGEHKFGAALVEKLESRDDLPDEVVANLDRVRQAYEKTRD